MTTTPTTSPHMPPPPPPGTNILTDHLAHQAPISDLISYVNTLKPQNMLY